MARAHAQKQSPTAHTGAPPDPSARAAGDQQTKTDQHRVRRTQLGATKLPAPTLTPAGVSSIPHPQMQSPDHSQALPPDPQPRGRRDHPKLAPANPASTTPHHKGHTTTGTRKKPDTPSHTAPHPNTRKQPELATPARPGQQPTTRGQTPTNSADHANYTRHSITATHQAHNNPAPATQPGNGDTHRRPPREPPPHSNPPPRTTKPRATGHLRVPRPANPPRQKQARRRQLATVTLTSDSQHPDHRPATASPGRTQTPPRVKPPHNTTPHATNTTNPRTRTTSAPSQQSGIHTPARKIRERHPTPRARIGGEPLSTATNLARSSHLGFYRG